MMQHECHHGSGAAEVGHAPGARSAVTELSAPAYLSVSVRLGLVKVREAACSRARFPRVHTPRCGAPKRSD